MANQSYEAQWQKDRQRWLVIIVVFLAGLPMGIAIELLRLAYPVQEVAGFAWFFLFVWADMTQDAPDVESR